MPEERLRISRSPPCSLCVLSSLGQGQPKVRREKGLSINGQLNVYVNSP